MNKPKICNVIKNIYDLKHKKYDFFENYHILITNDDMYISSAFAMYLNGGVIKNSNYSKFHLIKNHYVINSYNIKMSIYIYPVNSNIGYDYIICGCSGSTGYNGMQQSTKYKASISIKRKVNKYLIGEYLNSNLPRLEKIKKIINRIENE